MVYLTWLAMFGSGVLIGMVRTAVHHRQILRVLVHRLRIAIVFGAVRGTLTIRTTSGALIVAGTTQIAGTSASDFVFPQDLARILFSGAAIGSPFSGSGL